MSEQSERQDRALVIAAKSKLSKKGDKWHVPSQSGFAPFYEVDPQAPHCTCPDFQKRNQPCKHIYAVEIVIERETTTTTTDGTTTTTTTETVKVTRKTYAQVWPAYNAAQVNEKRLFLYLLNQLCQGIGSPSHTGPGRKPLPLEDMIFAMAFKVYSTVSTRRFMTDMTDAHSKGYVSQLPCYNSIINYFETEMLTDYLHMLIEESALPLAAIESDFAVDSTGISACRFVQWVTAKYKDNELIETKDWVKLHMICGVTTNVVTAAQVGERYSGDSPRLKPLVEKTAQGFTMKEVSADKAYLSGDNLKAVTDAKATPYIPFKVNSVAGEKRHSELWNRMYHYYAYNTDRFMKSYHKRSNAESTFHMIKAKFGDSVRSKMERAQINEVLCKVLCHNICCLIQSMYELNLKPKFWSLAS